ncbi:MAG: hypothetical protein IPO55_11670 [Alphaproteobacteria bacterium]|nr:hypothetical protein [Alphaproteobacteria bacterium]
MKRAYSEEEAEEIAEFEREMERLRILEEAEKARKKADDDGYRRRSKEAIADLIRVEAEIERRDKELERHYRGFRDYLKKIIKSYEAKL